jgi:hypothetical protein
VRLLESENVKRLLAASLVAGVVVAMLVWPRPRPAEPGEPAAETAPSAVAESVTADNLERQARCYEQAREAYADLGYPRGRIAGFGNHYNAKLERCFIHIANTEADAEAIWVYRKLVDVSARREFGAYAWQVRQGSAASDFSPARCEVTMPSGETRRCRSEEEFTELVSLYMEDF